MMVSRRALAGLLGVAVALAACTSPDRPTVQAQEVALPTPLRSFDAAVTEALGQLEVALAGVGERLEEPSRAYRPSEPQSLLQVPRVVRRVDLADPDDGFVIVYDTGEQVATGDLADELAGYLGSGFGQTNYVADTQFSVSMLGETIIFTTWSRRRSDDPSRAEAAFEAVASVGTPVEVRK